MNIKPFLSSSQIINSDHPKIIEQANKLAKGLTSQTDIAKTCFDYVRDEIPHSMDYKLNPVTLIASDVLKYKTGFCYAKSHLLAALLRTNNIAAGLCYQRLTITNEQPPFCLHGLNAIYLKEFGWFRVDPRGNKQNVDAQFNPIKEQLAFKITVKGECDLPEVWAEPIREIVNSLEKNKTYQQLSNNLPDVVCY